MRRRLLIMTAALVIAAVSAFAQAQDPAIGELVRTEQRFAARALVVGWKQAFLEYFADTAVGFDGERVAPAKTLFRGQPDPPKDLQLIWEPRYGDLAESGDIGYLTGPVRSINPARNNGLPAYSIYASVWRRQSDGTFKVVLDMGVPLPAAATFPDGFTRAPRRDGYNGNASPAASAKSLRDTDAALTNAARAGQADAYRDHLADGARLHRPSVMPLVGQNAIVTWLRGQQPYISGESKFAQTSTSGDLGYSYGSYVLRGEAADHGFYARVWTRGRDGVWRVALDILQPQ